LLQAPETGLFCCIVLLSGEILTVLRFSTMEFLVNAGGIIIKHDEEQLISLIAKFINEGKPSSGFFIKDVGCIAKHEDGQMMMGRTIETVSRLFNETSDDIMHRVKRWASEAA
jgi:hypothetical protein